MVKKCITQVTDNSQSIDDDIIKSIDWFVEYDSNNDGMFGTKFDKPKELFASGTQKVVIYETEYLGNYRFSNKVTEEFGQPTLQEFIIDEDYKTDVTESINPKGSIEDYLKDENFNIPEKDVSIEVDNAPPQVDFGMQRKNNVDIKINFGGLDTAIQQKKIGSVSGGGYYDHTYYTIDTTEKNKITSLAANLELDLISKGINANIFIDNSYFYQADTDGECRRYVPVWGWTTWTTYDYKTVTTTSSSYSPPSGWSITSSSSKDYYYTKRDWAEGCDLRKGSGWRLGDAMSDPSCDEGETYLVWYRDREVYDYTKYTYRLRKKEYNKRWEIQYYTDYGCNSTEQVDTTDFTQSFANTTYQSNADKFYIRFDKNGWNWIDNTSKRQNFQYKMKNEDLFFWSTGNEGLRQNVDYTINMGSKKGQFNVYDSTALEKQIQDIKDYMINKYMFVQDEENFTILLNDEIDYTVTYEDFENDPELKREWKFTHDPTQVNGRVIDNQPSATIAQNDVWINNPMQLKEVGTYKVQLRAMDDPIWWDDDRFFNYRKWSDEEIVREYTVNVHRRPVADFNFVIDQNNNNQLTLDTSLSYDPEHQFNRADKGIVEYKWSYYLDGVKYTGQPPKNLANEKFYDLTLEVRDIDGAYGSVTKRISTKTGNLKPVAKFSVQDIVYRSQKLNFIDTSFDPNGDPLTDYRISVRNQGSSTILKNLTSFPYSFKNMNLASGTYVIGLTVKDIPNSGPSLQSNLYEETIQVINDNQSPISRFTLSPSTIEKGKYLTYNDTSYDPDSHPLINYTWLVELLDDSNKTIQTWNTGAVPKDLREYAGVGRYRITQTVYDDPPFPLPSLSGSSSVIVEMVKGKEAPFAEFSWQPQNLVVGETFILDPTFSYDLDGDVKSYDWSIKAPNGAVTKSIARFPKVVNSQQGDYEVTLYVIDNDGLRSKLPASHTITVDPLPPNLPPIANFDWAPFKPFLGEKVSFNPDSSYDLDGEIVSYSWLFRHKDGTTEGSNQEYPEVVAKTSEIEATLTVTDDLGAAQSTTKTVAVDIADIESLVTHTDGWKQRWINEGYEADVNKFYAGEKFVIELKTTPAAYVWGSVNLGGEIGKVDIPKELFTLISTSKYEYLWKAELWREDFEQIQEGQYLFEFSSIHPVSSPNIQAKSTYLIDVVGNIYDSFKFHRNY